jgi:alkylation response protein AidB-like acyl-CoA dehydrogenase
MSTTTEEKKYIKGGAFLIEDYTPDDIFTPEDFTDEHRMISDTTRDFIDHEVLPKTSEIEEQNYDVIKTLLRKAGELGLLAVDIPEKYGGLGLDVQSSMLVAEQFGISGSFAVTHGAHAGIGTLPIVYYGTNEHKEKYLPKFATAELISSYSLSEPQAGSDAQSARTTARLTEDKKYYTLNGQKMWLSNAGIADVYITFAKIDGEQFSAFIIEKGMEGVTLGEEEKKLGIKGSSTRQLLLDNARVPAENQLGEIGKGFIIALNILNIGRFKLGAAAIGASKEIMKFAVRYAGERKQFGQPIAHFGLIKHKLAEMGIRIFAGESILYRTGGLINDLMHGVDESSSESGRLKLKAIEEYAVECAMVKVYCSEVLDYVVDEALQTYGGYGYSEEYPIARAYRDARINRIFEGTNEINRLLTPGMMLRRAMKGELGLTQAAMNVLNEILGGPSFGEEDTSLFGPEKKAVKNVKKAALMVAGSAVQKFTDKIADEQEILGHLADMLMDIYAMESTMLRTGKIVAQHGEDRARHAIELTKVFVNDAIARIEWSAKQSLAAFNEGDTLRTQLTALRRFTRYTPVNTVDLRRRIAERFSDKGDYFVMM